MHSSKKLILTLLLAPAVAGWLCAAPLGTAISYQGYLSDKGKPATDLYNFRFALYDAMTGGSLVGSPNTVTLSSVPVTNGLFSVALDFGSSAFLGDRRWLEIEVAPNGSSSYTKLSPRTELRPDAYSLYALKADTATTVGSVPWSALTGVPAGFADGTDDNTTYSAGAGLHLSGTTFSIADGGVTSIKLANGQVVRSLNGLTEAVTLSVGAGLTLTPNGNTLTLAASGGSSDWSLTGNSGTTPGVNFLGTTDNQPLEFKVNNSRALRLELGQSVNTISVNTIGGYRFNNVLNGAIGATIAGGGEEGTTLLLHAPNEIGADFGSIGGGSGNSISYGSWATIAGGAENLAGTDLFHTGNYSSVGGGSRNSAHGDYATIPGGKQNWAAGTFSLAAGRLANATHPGSFVWNSYGNRAYSFSPNRFHVFAENGFSVDYDAQREDGGGSHWAGFGVIPGQTLSTWTGSFLDDSGDWHCRNATVCTITITGGCDLAEPFQVSENEIPKGAVVIIDAEHPGKLKLSSEPYDTRVAGVVSGAGGVQPGIQMSQKGSLEGTENVALTGRVYVKADAAPGAITPGDLLTTSATPGHAMKVTDHARAQGAILGKAMSALSEGQGLVLVLVTLQ